METSRTNSSYVLNGRCSTRRGEISHTLAPDLNHAPASISACQFLPPIIHWVPAQLSHYLCSSHLYLTAWWPQSDSCDARYLDFPKRSRDVLSFIDGERSPLKKETQKVTRTALVREVLGV